MPNPFAVPEISVQETAKVQENGASFVWLDVREPAEYAVRIVDDRVKEAPLSQLAAAQLSALPPEALDKRCRDHRVLPSRHTQRPGRSMAATARLDKCAKYGRRH